MGFRRRMGIQDRGDPDESTRPDGAAGHARAREDDAPDDGRPSTDDSRLDADPRRHRLRHDGCPRRCRGPDLRAGAEREPGTLGGRRPLDPPDLRHQHPPYRRIRPPPRRLIRGPTTEDWLWLRGGRTDVNLDAAIDLPPFRGVVRRLRLIGTEAGRMDLLPRYALRLEVVADRVGAALRQRHVVLVRADRVGVALDVEDLVGVAREVLGELIQRRA